MRIKSTIKGLKRPRVLLRAAQINGLSYNREKALKRLLHRSKLPKNDVILENLLEQEDGLNAARLNGEAHYSIQKHISVLAALLMELRLNPV